MYDCFDRPIGSIRSAPANSSSFIRYERANNKAVFGWPTSSYSLGLGFRLSFRISVFYHAALFAAAVVDESYHRSDRSGQIPIDPVCLSDTTDRPLENTVCITCRSHCRVRANWSDRSSTCYRSTSVGPVLQRRSTTDHTIKTDTRSRRSRAI